MAGYGSSFEVIDHIVDELFDPALYPNLTRIVFTGHSAGGQFTQRYAALGKPAEFRFYEGIPHGFAVRTHPGFRPDAARQSFEEARRFVHTHLPRAAAAV